MFQLLLGLMFALAKPVPYAQLVAFLDTDQINTNIYGNGYYCADFAQDLVNNASRHGIKAITVGVLFTHDIGHAIVAFSTADEGTIYVEPQTDDIYPVVQIGAPLCTADLNLCIGNEPIREIWLNLEPPKEK